MGVPNHCGGRRMTAVSTEKSQQCHKYFLQYSTFASERPQVRTRGRLTCFLPWAPSNLVTPPLSRTKFKSFQATAWSRCFKKNQLGKNCCWNYVNQKIFGKRGRHFEKLAKKGMSRMTKQTVLRLKLTMVMWNFSFLC